MRIVQCCYLCQPTCAAFSFWPSFLYQFVQFLWVSGSDAESYNLLQTYRKYSTFWCRHWRTLASSISTVCYVLSCKQPLSCISSPVCCPGKTPRYLHCSTNSTSSPMMVTVFGLLLVLLKSTTFSFVLFIFKIIMSEHLLNARLAFYGKTRVYRRKQERNWGSSAFVKNVLHTPNNYFTLAKTTTKLWKGDRCAESISTMTCKMLAKLALMTEATSGFTVNLPAWCVMGIFFASSLPERKNQLAVEPDLLWSRRWTHLLFGMMQIFFFSSSCSFLAPCSVLIPIIQFESQVERFLYLEGMWNFHVQQVFSCLEMQSQEDLSVMLN